jgi:hypothetical protein
MSGITVRRVTFRFPESLDEVLPGLDLRRRWLRTFAPGCDPGALEPGPLVGTVLASVAP